VGPRVPPGEGGAPPSLLPRILRRSGPLAAGVPQPAEEPLRRVDAEPRGLRLLLSYDGGRYHGWQWQVGVGTVQGELEHAIRGVTGQEIRVNGAGRTDTGVHALGQVASFRVATHVPTARLRAALNAHLPRDVRVLRVAEAPDSFHARFSAVWRRYRYLLAREELPFLQGRAWIPKGWPELEPMQAALPCLLGEHEFRGFTTQPDAPFGCFVHEARWERWEGGFAFVIRSNRFLYQMVRILVGTCVEIGRGKRPVEGLATALAAGDRRAAGMLAPSCGLYLTDVGYDPPWPEDPPATVTGPPLGRP